MSQAKAEAEELLESVELAKKLLQENGEFFPFGAAMKHDGEIVSIAGDMGDERPRSQEIIDLLKAHFVEAAREGEYRATAIVFDVRVVIDDAGNKSDSIAAALDHKENFSVIVFFPYSIQGQSILYGEVFAQEGEYDIFR